MTKLYRNQVIVDSVDLHRALEKDFPGTDSYNRSSVVSAIHEMDDTVGQNSLYSVEVKLSENEEDYWIEYQDPDEAFEEFKSNPDSHLSYWALVGALRYYSSQGQLPVQDVYDIEVWW